MMFSKILDFFSDKKEEPIVEKKESNVTAKAEELNRIFERYGATSREEVFEFFKSSEIYINYIKWEEFNNKLQTLCSEIVIELSAGGVLITLDGRDVVLRASKNDNGISYIDQTISFCKAELLYKNLVFPIVANCNLLSMTIDDGTRNQVMADSLFVKTKDVMMNIFKHDGHLTQTKLYSSSELTDLCTLMKPGEWFTFYGDKVSLFKKDCNRFRIHIGNYLYAECHIIEAPRLLVTALACNMTKNKRRNDNDTINNS